MIDYAGSKAEPLSPHSGPPRMIRVLAPAALPPGYELHIESKDAASFNVVVPPGGVCEGEIFLAPIPQGYRTEELTNSPTGEWKDGLFDLFRYGIGHPSFCCAFLCTEIAMGQIMQRMRLSWTGTRTVGDRALTSFRTVFTLVVCFATFNFALGAYIFATDGVDEDGDKYYDFSDISSVVPNIRNVGGILFMFWSIFALYKMRQNVRSEFSIPEEQCIGCEDLVCATFCGFCTVAQIARHTGDYESHQGLFCSETGLPDHAPLAAPMTV